MIPYFSFPRPRPARLVEQVAPPIEPWDHPLTRTQIDAIANVLHLRWHGDPTEHRPEYGYIRCAELAGAYDDAKALAPLIAEWLKG